MKIKNVFAFLSCMLFLLLVGCNNDEREAYDSNNHGAISSVKTNINSKDYPQTTYVKTQDAKYETRILVSPYYPNDVNIYQKATPDTNQTPNNSYETQPNPQTPSTNDDWGERSDFVAAVIDLTNAERQKQGLKALQTYPDLNNVADVKAKDMNEKGYFSHTSPTYGSPFDMMRDFGIPYQSAGENIAQGQRTPEEVVSAWMNSEGHRANILNDNYTHIGVGFYEGGYEWVQMFVKK